jgi:integrase
MNHIDREMREAKMRTAVKLPSLIDGEKLRQPKYEVRRRPSQYLAVFADSVYVATTGTKDEKEALQFLDIYRLQQEARAENIIDCRKADAVAILDHRIRTAAPERAGYRSACDGLRRLKPYLEGRRLRQLNDDWAAETEEEMLATYSLASVRISLEHYRTAIRVYCKANDASPFYPYDRRPAAPGRTRVVTTAEKERMLRWGRGTENYDPQTDTWSPPQDDLTEAQLNYRRMVYRKAYLGLKFGSRPGVYEGLSWTPHPEYGHIDLENAVFHRVPVGSVKSKIKRAPAVALPPGALAELRRWKEEDGDELFVFRTWYGEPLGQPRLSEIFKDAMAVLGIPDVFGHTLRHTAITVMITKGLSPKVISEVCGVTIPILHKRYDHTDSRTVQVLAHAVLDDMD